MLTCRKFSAWLCCLGLYLLSHPVLAIGQDPLLVSTDWLANQLNSQRLLVVDTRSSELYDQGHIPGAINIPVEKTFANTGKTYRVGNIQQMAHLFSEHGLLPDDHIVLYDDGRLIDAARFFWVLEVFGHTRVSLMDGGMPAWVSDNRELESIRRQRPPSQFIPTIVQQYLTTKLAMQVAIQNPAVAIVDARTADEYQGKHSNASRSGHIPNAINIPWDMNIDPGSGIKRVISESGMASHYKPLENKRIITYCNKGKQSALTYVVLRHLGYQVSVYDGAWLEWGNDNTLPIE